MLSGDGGDVAIVIGADGLLMIDGGLPSAPADLHESRGRRGRPQGDHAVQYALAFRSRPAATKRLGRMGTKIVAHENTKKHLAVRTTMETANRTFEAAEARRAAGGKTFTTGGKMTFGKQQLDARTFRSRTPTATRIIFFPALNVLQPVTCCSTAAFPVIDYSTGGWIGGMAAAARRSARSATRPDAHVIPGHGVMATKADLEATHDMLATIHDRLAPMIKAGKTVEEAIAAKPTAEFDARFGQRRAQARRVRAESPIPAS